jgi:hypothetical protein
MMGHTPKWLLVALGALALFAACGGDDEASPTTTETIAERLSDREQIEKVAAAWAQGFGAGRLTMCKYLTPDGYSLCGYWADSDKPGWQEAFVGSQPTGVEIDGKKATVSFDNGQRVVLVKIADSKDKTLRLRGIDPDAQWYVSNYGGALRD